MKRLLQQLKQRRLALGLKQNDMKLRAGISRQQYQRLESRGNPRLETLELITQGLNCEMMLIPREKLRAVVAVLAEDSLQGERRDGVSTNDASSGYRKNISVSRSHANAEKDLSEDPWQGLLGDDG